MREHTVMYVKLDFTPCEKEEAEMIIEFLPNGKNEFSITERGLTKRALDAASAPPVKHNSSLEFDPATKSDSQPRQ